MKANIDLQNFGNKIVQRFEASGLFFLPFSYMFTSSLSLAILYFRAMLSINQKVNVSIGSITAITYC